MISILRAPNFRFEHGTENLRTCPGYVTVFIYDTTITSLIMITVTRQFFCQHDMHDSTYDTHIVASLIYSRN